MIIVFTVTRIYFADTLHVPQSKYSKFYMNLFTPLMRFGVRDKNQTLIYSDNIYHEMELHYLKSIKHDPNHAIIWVCVRSIS